MRPAPAPRVVTVAVTGHRLNQLPEGERPRIRDQIAASLDRIEAAALAVCQGRARFTLVSAIAEGADRYAADLALSRGWRLVTPLPFDAARYEQDFEDAESKAHYQRLLWASHRVAPVRADAVAAIGGRAAEYAAVGRAVIERADLLLCVWNGLPPKGPGGTSEVAALMLERGGLVLWIAVGAGVAAPVRLVGPAPLPRAGSFRRNLHEALAQHYDRAARPPEMRVA
ncbi:MAG: hypothetical protein GC206_06580 [Alphaproteobacteria bacterium]|nr:hypothetical protein [Alphaproteobacteria bacterium]